ncbi:aldose epimerase family protein [Mariniblastus fucicola]|uniref:Aldose 1-epimerase n=1 Tax=Mariniblastus fucicola TaxID=980251 RepID=A0A5B9PAL3_9BACT|nr:aldose epimerase family protein [Mariniblastus fucicola]QEG23304.1 Aldose 1-epimerase precursor [Mariniblastus fucicola]
MRLGIILLAFTFGCIATAFIRVAPKNANADNGSSDVADVEEFSLSENQESTQEPQILDVVKHPFGETSDGRPVQKFICTNSQGYTLEMMDYGAAIVAMKVPGKDGEATVNVALNCNDMAGYSACSSFFGCTVGRYCNRIADGKFSIDGKEYALAKNGGPHHLHGGAAGFDKQVWSSEVIRTDDAVGVRFSLTSPDGDEGYPGEVKAVAEYTLDEKNQLKMVFTATTDSPTHVNLCNHNYWNIAGAGSGSVMDHELQLACEEVLECDETLIPTGKILKTQGDAFFDYSTAKPLSAGMKAAPSGANGYDHCFVVKRSAANELALIGSVRDPKSGRTMTVFTTQPGVQLYTANHFNGQPGSGGFEKHGAICFESQHYPDTPNHPDFPTTLLKPGQTMTHTTVHQFSYE